MIKTYNGKSNPHIIRELQGICEVTQQNKQTLMNAFNENGFVSFYTNLDFLGMPDEMPEIKTLNNEEEILEYLKEDFERRITTYLQNKKTDDHLLTLLIEFIRKYNGEFPNADEMKKLKKLAEVRRITELPIHMTPPGVQNNVQTLLKEVLELSEEIFETVRLKAPNCIIIPDEASPEMLYIETESLRIHIKYDRYGCKDFRNYGCLIKIKEHEQINKISISYDVDGIPVARANTFLRKSFKGHFIQELIAIHKNISQIALNQNIEFTSDIDYSTISEK